MRKFKLNHWFVGDNELSISLMRYYVDINMNLNENGEIYFILRVIDSNQKELLFDFNSIEKAVTFTEAIIDKCSTYEQIEEAYNIYYGNDEDKKLIKRN